MGLLAKTIVQNQNDILPRFHYYENLYSFHLRTFVLLSVAGVMASR